VSNAIQIRHSTKDSVISVAMKRDMVNGAVQKISSSDSERRREFWII